mmetsp:Transcript_38624/g.97250  ORF Transcript_38624/g.97250 Transcript_38624/m.97250 type:complete len:552 (+) Transcript_38624:182-1837(+)
MEWLSFFNVSAIVSLADVQWEICSARKLADEPSSALVVALLFSLLGVLAFILVVYCLLRRQSTQSGSRLHETGEETVKTICFFCHTWQQQPRSLVNAESTGFSCVECGQYNGFDSATGDYNRTIPAMYDSSLNTASLRSPVAAHEYTAADLDRCALRRRAHSQSFSSPDTLSPSVPQSNGASAYSDLPRGRLCALCTHKRALLASLLSDYEAPPHLAVARGARAEKARRAAFDAYRAELEESHSLCEQCERVLQELIRAQDRRLRFHRLGRVLEVSDPRQVRPRLLSARTGSARSLRHLSSELVARLGELPFLGLLLLLCHLVLRERQHLLSLPLLMQLIGLLPSTQLSAAVLLCFIVFRGPLAALLWQCSIPIAPLRFGRIRNVPWLVFSLVLFQFFQWMSRDDLCTMDPNRDQVIAVLEEEAWLLSVCALLISILLYTGTPQWLGEHILPLVLKPVLRLWSWLVNRNRPASARVSSANRQQRTLSKVNPTYLFPKPSSRSIHDEDDPYSNVVEQPEELGVEGLFESFTLGDLILSTSEANNQTTRPHSK